MKKLIFVLAVAMTLFSGCSDDDDNNIVPGGSVNGSSNEQGPGNEYQGDPVPDEHYLGTLCAFNGSHRVGDFGDPAEYETNEYFNLPLFKSSYTADVPECEEEWWDNLVEELAYSGVDFVVMNCRGQLHRLGAVEEGEKDHGNPTKLTELITAMERRGVADKFKIAVFDDCPASWDAARNYDLGNEYANSGMNAFPLSDLEDIYKYIWDYNLKLAFETIPEKYWFKFMNRPVIYFWSLNKFLSGDHYGELRTILAKIREDFNAEFHCDPYLIVDKGFLERDKSLYYTSYVDAVNDWFTTPTPPYSIHEWYSGAKMGIGVPGFKKKTQIIDPKGGDQLVETLKNTIGKGAHLTMIEGFTDTYENAALWRSTDAVYYKYPNQRINIMRRFSKNPYPAELKVEAEGCDSFHDITEGNAPGSYRAGDLDIDKCGDQYLGWCVVNTEAGEWMEWKELPFRAQETSMMIRYRSTAVASVSFTVDEGESAVVLDAVSLPATNGEWKTLEAGKISFTENGLHTVRLNIVSGSPDINYFVITNNHE